MISRILPALSAALLLLGISGSVSAATWGVEAGVSTASPCPSFCGGPGAVFDSDSDGGEFFTTAYASLDNADGNAQAQAQFTGASLLPDLSAEGFSGANSRASAGAYGMLGYTYSGAAATTISLDIMLDGEVGGTTDPGDAWVESNVAVILGDVNSFITDYPTLILEVVPGTPGLSVLGESLIFLDLNAGLQTKTGSIGLTLNPGDEFFVWAGLGAGGVRGGFGDAFGTLSMSFSDDTGITPNVVPVPAALWLFSSGLFGLIAIARRRKTS